MEWHCFAHTSLPPEIAAEVDALPVIPFLPGQVRRGLTPIHRLTAFMDGAENLPGILRKNYPGEPRSDDLLYLGYATDVEMIGVARWLEGIKATKRPRVVFFHHHPAHEWKTDPASMTVEGDFHRWIYAAKRLYSVAPNIRYFGSIPALSKELSRVLQVPFSTLTITPPIPRDFDPAGVETSHDIGILGGSRTEQGITLVPSILRYLKFRRPACRVLLQCMKGRQETNMRQIMKKDGTEGMVSLISDPGSAEDYLQRIASCRLILLPYLPEKYCLRNSGVFMDANCVGRPVVASAQTSMGRMILAGISSGTVFRSMDPMAIAGAACDALDRMEDLSSRSRHFSPEWRQRLSTDVLLKKLLAGFQNS
jgi:glycosyltransferase involved in cell wall biosynthesis